MAASVAKAARNLGVPPDGARRLGMAHALAMASRIRRLDDDHHPLYLHPGRTALILMRDVACGDPLVLAAAMMVESEDAEFRVDGAVIESSLGPEVAELVRAVPLPDSETLAETLVVGREPVRLVALAERLDHLRHAHLRDAPADWRREAHHQAEQVYRPVAHRTHPRLAQRYDHWCRTFAKRLSRS
jgi:(p)ppGpp synthase/HD superfamily hydrolase